MLLTLDIPKALDNTVFGGCQTLNTRVVAPGDYIIEVLGCEESCTMRVKQNIIQQSILVALALLSSPKPLVIELFRSRQQVAQRVQVLLY